MGQKVNPVSLRIGLHRRFDSSFFQETNYSTIFFKDFTLRSYLKAVFHRLDAYPGRIVSQLGYKKHRFSLFTYSFGKIRKNLRESTKYWKDQEKSDTMRKKAVSHESLREGSLVGSIARIPSIRGTFKKDTHFVSSNVGMAKVSSLTPHSRRIPLFLERAFSENKTSAILASLLLLARHREQKGFSNPINTLERALCMLHMYNYEGQQRALAQRTQKKTVLKKIGSQPHQFTSARVGIEPVSYASNSWQSNGLQRLSTVESHAKAFFPGTVVAAPVVLQTKGGAAFFARFLVLLLQRTKDKYRKLMKYVIQEAKQSKDIVGIRIMCSGRLGGAEMAQIETQKWGQTSTHVFSNKLDYSSQSAYTKYGVIGVKVWVCYGR